MKNLLILMSKSRDYKSDLVKWHASIPIIIVRNLLVNVCF